MKLARLWHTVRYLRPIQIWARLWFRLYRPRPDLRAAPPLRSFPAWRGCARASTLVSAQRLRFLNLERELISAADWCREAWGRLWLYNLHYFDDLVADGAPERVDWHRDLIGRWIADNAPGRGVGWEPYPTSLRIVNWVKWSWAGNALGEEGLHSLAVQARWLRRRLEYHLLGNHLWANAKALVFAGAFFDGPQADAWRRRGLALIARQLDEQILPDGGHFELSPMYHAIVLEDLIDLIQLAEAGGGLVPPDLALRLRSAAERMGKWLAVMTHPDGEPAFFNDTALGIAPSRADLEAYAADQGLAAVGNDAGGEAFSLPDSGYVRLNSGPARLLADVGRIGPDYLPGHAHADSLSFEFSLGERRVFVNGGISTYEAGPERQRQRGTASHNTVVVDGADSSEVWGAFRVARRARPLGVAVGRDDAGPRLAAAHDGYWHLPGRVRHDRAWSLAPNRLLVRDRLGGNFSHAVARFRLHPDVGVTAHSDRTGTIEAPGLKLSWRASAPVRIVPETWHPGFNLSLACQVMELSFLETTVELVLEWA